MTIVAILGRGGVGAAEVARGLATLSEVGRERTVSLGHGGPGAEGYEAPDLLLVSQGCAGTPAARIADGYRESGVGCVPGLEGPYAFALYDRKKRLLLATSDLTSRAPLAYWSRDGAVVVSSRVLRIVGYPGVGRAIDENYLAHIATGFWSPPPGSTALGDVKRLPAGVALVAVEGRVQLVAADQLAPLSRPERAKHFWIEALWRELEGATARSLAEPSPCLSLSGGLDSAVLAAAARPTRAHQPLETFSMVAASDIDERDAIDATASSPGLLNRKVDCDGCGDLHGLDAFELPDDPFMQPLTFLPSRLRLWKEVKEARFRTLIDGEGADELFGMLPGPRHALLERQWGAALRHLRAQEGGRRALFTRSFVVPSLPSMVGHVLARRKGMEGARLPTFMSAQARIHPAIQQAGYEFHALQVDDDLKGNFLRWLSMPAVVGAAATHRHLAASLGLRLASPMLDRRVVEVVLGTPAEHLVSPVPKGFLRDAAIGRVPDAVRTRAKDNRLPEAFLRRIVASQSARDPLRDPRVRERLGGWIRFERFEGMLDSIASGHELSLVLWQQVEGLVAFAYWYSRASRELGIA